MKKNKLFLAVALLLMAMTSCVKTEYHYIDESYKTWFVDRDKADFTVTDENGISQDFHFDATLTSMLEGSASFLFVTTDKDLCEHEYQIGRTTYYQGDACSLGITNYYSTSTYFSLCFYDVRFNFDMYDNGEFSCQQCSDEKFIERYYRCSMELLDSHEVNGVTYHDVIHLWVTDFDALTRPDFPTELYYAKHYGPVEYKLGELAFTREGN